GREDAGVDEAAASGQGVELLAGLVLAVGGADEEFPGCSRSRACPTAPTPQPYPENARSGFTTSARRLFWPAAGTAGDYLYVNLAPAPGVGLRRGDWGGAGSRPGSATPHLGTFL